MGNPGTVALDPREAATQKALAAGKFQSYQKKIPTLALRMDEDFLVQTTEGTMEGKAGDYLCLDSKGNPYPCAAGVFEESYTPVVEKGPAPVPSDE